jgi:hypothetical protein
VGFRDDPLGHPFVQRTSDDLAKKLERLSAAKSFQPQLRKSREHIGRRRRPRREEEHYGVRSDASRDECEHLCRGLIEPLRVVYDAEQRLLSTNLREQPEDGKTEEKAVRRDPRAQTEGRLDCIPLRLRQQLEAIEERSAQLVQTGERKLHLGLNSDRSRYANTCRSGQRVLQEGRFSDARVTADN